MAVLTSSLDTAGETYRANRAAQLALLEQLNEQVELAIAGGGDRYQQRHRARGKLLARERIELLLDPDSPFLELSTLAAYGTQFTVGASLITGIGVVSGVECVIIANDPTVRGGSVNPYSLRKSLRAREIARANRLPVINLVESGGADLPTQLDLFVPGGRTFRDLTELSAMGIPTIALVFGNSTAGGAYVPGMSDYSVFVDRRAKVFLGGPPLVRWPPARRATTRRSAGRPCTRGCPGFRTTSPPTSRTRSGSGGTSWPGSTGATRAAADASPAGPRVRPGRDLGIVPADVKVPFDPREVLARTVDGSEFDEYKPLYGTSLVTGWARLHGYPVGILANHRGVLFSEESKEC